MRFHFVFAVAALVHGPLLAARDWIIEPGVRVGPITAETSEKDLVTIYGSTNVVSANIYVGEGFEVPGTILFPQTDRSISIVWKSSETKSGVAQILITATRSVWKTKEGLAIGTPLKVIERLNGRPFELSGFGSDYSGGVTNSNGGKLNYLSTDKLFIMLSPDPKWQEEPEYQSVIGFDAFSSSHPVIQKMNPAVSYMRVSFNAR